jgi:transcriptional regulator GlxA family with amidase domain
MSQETFAENQDFRVGTTRNIVFVAFPDVQMLDVCGPFDAFSFANRAMDAAGMVDRPLYRIEVVAEQAGPLMTCSGLQIVAHHAYAEIDDPIDTLIVAGGVAALERAVSDAAFGRVDQRNGDTGTAGRIGLHRCISTRGGRSLGGSASDHSLGLD